MAPSPDTAEPDFYLGDRGGYGPIDFDGHVRECRLIRALHSGRRGTSKYREFLLVSISPPLKVGDRDRSELLLSEYSRQGTFSVPDDRPIPVAIDIVPDGLSSTSPRVDTKTLKAYSPGEIARARDLLPKSPDESFAQGLECLKRFARREGHTDASLFHTENGCNLGVWISNIRPFQLDMERARQLAGIPEWTWLSSYDIEVLRRFAQREDNTNIPKAYREGDVPLGELVAQVRLQHERGLVGGREQEHLEEVPFWHW